jgi:metal-dependent amidase/aminoacylase/carboxypeptidase family protein
LQYKWEEDFYAPVINNLAICKLFVSNMRHLGRQIRLEDPKEGFGSTDFGNVSQIVPGMHAQVGITDGKVAVHSLLFVEAAISEKGLQSMLQAAQGLAMTAVDLMVSADLVQKAKNEFSKNRKNSKS